MEELAIMQTGSKLDLPILNNHAAGIDVGSMLMMSSYTNSQGQQCLLSSNSYTESLEALADLLKNEGVISVAMEATGVYWMSLYEILESRGLEVYLVNPRHFKNVAAQKTDVLDCQWLHNLHAHGMLRNSHIAKDLYRELKNYLHERGNIQKQKESTLNRIHRLLTLLNIKYQHLVSDIEGVGSMKLLRAIARGETRPEKLLELLDLRRFKASKESLLSSLEGNCKKEYINLLRMKLQEYDFFISQMKSYEELIEEVLKRLLPVPSTKISTRKRKARKNEFGFNVQGYLKEITEVDLCAIDGLDEKTVLTILSVVGIDMNKWPTSQHFTSWLCLSPRIRTSGGKKLGHQKQFTRSIASLSFRLAAQSLWNNKGSLGDLYRRLSARKNSKTAIKAVARKIAVVFYTMLKNKEEYNPKKIEIMTEKQQMHKLRRLQKEAEKLGMLLVAKAS